MLVRSQILVKCVRGVNWFVSFRGIFAAVFEDDLGTAGMIYEIIQPLSSCSGSVLSCKAVIPGKNSVTS